MKDRKTELPKRRVANAVDRVWKRVWPQIPLGLLLLFTGVVNLLTGLQSQGFSSAYQILAHVVPLSQLGQEVSLGILGTGVQVLLGSAMLVTGFGLFWRIRSAWAYTILFVLIAIAVDLVSQRPLRDVLMPGLALIALLIWQNRFDRQSLVGIYLMSFIGLLAVFLYGIFGSLLLGNRFQPGIHDLPTALYFTVVTLSTVGSNIYPAAPEAQYFMVTLILGGISIFTTTIVTTLGPLISNQINPLLSGKKVQVDISGRVILIGSSPFANSVAHELASHAIGFVQVVKPGATPPLEEQPVVRGEPSVETFEGAGISTAGTVIIAGDDDAANAIAASTAKKLNPDARVVVAASSSQGIARIKSAHPDLVFTAPAVGARLLVNLIGGMSPPKELRDLFEGP
jgi:voltage-gated potassium channel